MAHRPVVQYLLSFLICHICFLLTRCFSSFDLIIFIFCKFYWWFDISSLMAYKWQFWMTFSCFRLYICRSSSQKYGPLDWSDYFDKEDDVQISDSNDVSELSVNVLYCFFLPACSFFLLNRRIIFYFLWHFRSFMFIWQGLKDRWFYAYMVVVILGMLNLLWGEICNDFLKYISFLIPVIT